MKSLVDLLTILLHECGRQCGAPVDRDVKTLRRRVEHEGDSFITIALPAFCRDFESCLKAECVLPGLFQSFGKGKSGIPAFLSGFLQHVFDAKGKLRGTPSVDCIRKIRQICLFSKKIVRKCSHERERAATDAYLECDEQIQETPGLGLTQLFRYYLRVADLIVDDLCLTGERLWALDPRHGRGATGERLTRNARWTFRSWHRRLEMAGFTWSDFGRAQATPPSTIEGDDYTRLIEPWDEDPVRVVFVPKTATTPRVIAVEPACMQYAQQALRGVLTRAIDDSPLTSGHVNFTSQKVNQEMAMAGSVVGNNATIDMSEASDRVGVAHVQGLFRRAPIFLELLMAARTTRARLPDGRVTVLKKFASMGSATTFPVESLAFYTSIIASRLLKRGSFPTRASVHESGRDVYVYGDDLIVPADEAPSICGDLEALGFKVNRHKSFWTGKFRESCGVDAFAGELVTPVYLRDPCPADASDASRILSWVATANQLSSAGYHATSTAMRNAVERVTGSLPCVPTDSPVLGWHDYSTYMPRSRYNRHLQRKEFRCLVPKVPKRADPLTGDGALLKCFWVMGKHPKSPSVLETLAVDPDHLTHSVIPYGVALERKWVSAENISAGVAIG